MQRGAIVDTVFCSEYIFCFGSKVQISIFSTILVHVCTVRLRVLGYYCQGLYYYLITLCIYILCLIFVYLYSILYIIVLLCTTCHFNIVILIYCVFILVYHIILIIFYYIFYILSFYNINCYIMCLYSYIILYIYTLY